MKKEVKIGFSFTPDIEKYMEMFYDSLNEKDQRHYREYFMKGVVKVRIIF